MIKNASGAVGNKRPSVQTTKAAHQQENIFGLSKAEQKAAEMASRQQVLYSDDSYKRLAQNDTLRYDGYSEVIKEFKNTSSRSVYLLNSKYKFRQYIAF